MDRSWLLVLVIASDGKVVGGWSEVVLVSLVGVGVERVWGAVMAVVWASVLALDGVYGLGAGGDGWCVVYG